MDFVCLEKKVVIELDGGQHNEAESRDKERDAWLRKQGYIVLRFWNHEVFKQTHSVRELIWKTLQETPSFILPRARGRNKDSAKRVR